MPFVALLEDQDIDCKEQTDQYAHKQHDHIGSDRGGGKDQVLAVIDIHIQIIRDPRNGIGDSQFDLPAGFRILHRIRKLVSGQLVSPVNHTDNLLIQVFHEIPDRFVKLRSDERKKRGNQPDQNHGRQHHTEDTHCIAAFLSRPLSPF